eukprot:Protomagalhaensia_wolfi_Nauph_80__5966@NODE_7_length_6263_cov_54_814267_g5_i0_p3_GENE_NODE_7_length_6263_cov_54_814267_g5_i0NODE_7_length_6263_cov_54_814267_g5_i0_p3_ORF_typecomplete_len305_score28_42_NODE_7_length_6263_cov_54_814267_g5_i040684982
MWTALCWAAAFTLVAALDGDLVRVQCDTAYLDSLAPPHLDPQICHDACEASCAEAETDSTVDACLNKPDYWGCLFGVRRSRILTLNHCSVNETSLAILFPAASLSGLAQAPVANAALTVTAASTGDSVACSGHATVGLSGTSFDPSSCTILALSQRSVSVETQSPFNLDITEVLLDAMEPLTTLNFFAAFDCPVSARQVQVHLTYGYDDGFRSDCPMQAGCVCSRFDGCTLCDWSNTQSGATPTLPDWLPAWFQRISGGLTYSRICGLNSGLCAAVHGTPMVQCSAFPTILWTLTSLLIATLSI